MKKTLLALSLSICFAGAVMATSIDDAVYSLTNVDDTYTAISVADYGVGTAFTVTAVLDLDALRGTDGKLNPSTWNKLSIFTVIANSNGIGAAFVGGDLKGTNQRASASTEITSYYTPNTSWSPSNPLSTSVWTGATSAVLSLDYSKTNGSAFTLTIAYGNLTVSTYTRSASNLNWSSISSFNDLTLNTDLVSAVYLFDSELSSSDIKAIQEKLIPEPATATLSLLALAGLAARRRRK